MKKILILLLLTLSIKVSARYEGFNNIALEGEINSGIIYSSQTEPSKIKKEILSQLTFSLGQLNYYDAVARLTNIGINIIKKEKLTRSYRYTYSAKLQVSWPSEQDFPNEFNLILPERGSESFLQGPWYQEYGNLNRKFHEELDCFNHDTNRIDIYNHWYHYRPHKESCLLLHRKSGDKDFAVSFPMSLTFSDRNTDQKYPEYDKIWEDNTLNIIAIFGSYLKNPKKNDPGKAAYDNYLHNLNRYLKTPISETGDYKNNIRTFELRDGRKIRVHSFFTHHLSQESQTFISSFNQSSNKADFVFYSGHAGLGSNVRFLEELGKPDPGQYQVYFISGCDSYAYIDTTLQRRHSKINNAPYSKHLDIITNAMAGYFHEGPRSVLRFVEGFLKKRHSYSEILSKIDPNQRASVIGEQDNMWPNSF